MSEELDRRIAIEVFGEEEPPISEWERGLSEGGAWFSVSTMTHPSEPRWIPKRFSYSLEQALRAVDKYFAEWSANFRAEVPSIHPTPQLKMQYSPHHDKPCVATFGRSCGYGQTLPEAICRLLLALKESQ